MLLNHLLFFRCVFTCSPYEFWHLVFELQISQICFFITTWHGVFRIYSIVLLVLSFDLRWREHSLHQFFSFESKLILSHIPCLNIIVWVILSLLSSTPVRSYPHYIHNKNHSTDNFFCYQPMKVRKLDNVVFLVVLLLEFSPFLWLCELELWL